MHTVGRPMANTTTTSTKEVNMLILKGLPERGNMIRDEDAYHREKKARDIYLNGNSRVSFLEKTSVVSSSRIC